MAGPAASQPSTDLALWLDPSRVVGQTMINGRQPPPAPTFPAHAAPQVSSLGMWVLSLVQTKHLPGFQLLQGHSMSLHLQQVKYLPGLLILKQRGKLPVFGITYCSELQADRIGLCSYVGLQHRLKDWCNSCKFISFYQVPVCGYTAPSHPPSSSSMELIYH